MIYEMVEQLKRNHVKDAVMTGAFILIDLAECAAEIMAAFGLINPIIVPVLAIASTALLVGQAIYQAVAKVKEIQRIIPLDADEYEYEYFKGLLHIGTSEYIQHLVDEKQANEFLASRVFEKYPDIKRFLVSAAIYKENKNISFIDNNIIDLTRMRSIEKRNGNATAYLKTTGSIFDIMEKYAKLIENDPLTTLIVETGEEKLVFSHNYNRIEVDGIMKDFN
uniref:Uncharacterized protein n=1 Tax=Romanomermis culicivorax TaxID=13658 RepID=A0A915JIZ7_ROMCU